MTASFQRIPFQARKLYAGFQFAARLGRGTMQGGRSSDSRVARFWCVIFLGLISSSGAYADTGLPLIVVLCPFFALSFVPIVLIEAFVLRICYTLPWKLSRRTAFTSNLVSTIAGIPGAWFVMTAIQMATGGGNPIEIYERPLWFNILFPPGWIGSESGSMKWSVLAHVLALFPVCFIASCIIETFVSERMLRAERIETLSLGRIVVLANVLSYIMLIGLLYFWRYALSIWIAFINIT
jgi:hypothetical protein